MSGSQDAKDRAHMGEIVPAALVITPGMDQRQARNVILLLTACMGVMMTGFGIIFPIFARRVGEFGSGVEALATMTMAYSLASLVAAPFMGSLADRFGRRPIVLGALAAYVAVNIGFLMAASPATFIVIRALEGAFMAGLGPAGMGIIADISPENQRARWIGILGSGNAVGWAVGPLIGGVLYDQWGYVAPFAVSAVMAFIAFMAAFFMIPETRMQEERRRDMLRQRRAAENASATAPAASFWAALPRPLSTFVLLLFVSLSIVLAWFLIDPQLPFYVFDELGWATAQFGVAVGSYGWASLLGQALLGQLSDRWGRKPALVVGLALHSLQYVGLAITGSYPLLLLAFVLAGLGEALLLPALSAFYLDITPEQHRARVMGFKGAVGSLGNLAGPALVMIVIRFVPPQNVFILSAVLVLLSALLALVILREPSRAVEERVDLAWEISNRRATAAQASLRGVVLSAATARKLKKVS